jgi:hypothetical protein
VEQAFVHDGFDDHIDALLADEQRHSQYKKGKWLAHDDWHAGVEKLALRDLRK